MHGPLGPSSPPAIAFALALATSIALPGQADDPAANLRNKSIDVRLAAIDALGGGARGDGDKLLLPLLADKDWEIQERTARALGKLKSKAALRPLLDLATGGDVARLRQAAAEALAAIDAAEAAVQLSKKARGKEQVAAHEALALVNRGGKPLPDADKLKKLLRHEDAPLRESAAAAWLECAADRALALRTLLAEPFLVVRCRALDAVAAAPRAEDHGPIGDLLGAEAQNDLVERRLLRACVAIVTGAAAADRARLATSLLDKTGTKSHGLARLARLAALLARGESPVLDKKDALVAVTTALGDAGTRARAAAAKALREIGGADALSRALERFAVEEEARVRWQLLETIVALRPPTEAEAAAWLVGVIAKDQDSAVREHAIVLLGRPGVPGSAAALGLQLGDVEWPLACCAAVSLGKTGDAAAGAPLQQLLQHADWTRRGAAVIGLMHWNRAESVEPLIAMLADPHPVVARSAHEALRAMSLCVDIAPNATAWRAWWSAHKGKHQFVDRRQSIEKHKKYGYSVPDVDIYQGLDVIVFESRGDHIEQLLDRLKIAHRRTSSGKVLEAGVHPEAVFVSNCTGEIRGDDLDALIWFVRTGGSLFGSCWALTETIAKVAPDVVRKHATPGDVLDNVRALPCRSDSALLRGVFPTGTVPIYRLEGAHLIDVRDPERCEVLIDSPDAAERHGSGNLAAWFTCGHGVILDSVNHFDLQGLEVAPGLANERDRQVYAVDHMGLDYATWRASQKDPFWKTAPRASQHVPDLSAFRFVTNFVRSKRLGEY